MNKLKMNLQLFSEAVQGKKLIYLYRILKEATTVDAVQIAFTTENSISENKDAESMSTKDGNIRTPGTLEVEISATSILSVGDTMIEKLRKAMREDELIEIWEANLLEPGAGENQFKGTYYQGYLTSFEKSSPSDGFVECPLTFGVNGSGKEGDVTVTADQQEVADYVFADTQKTGA